MFENASLANVQGILGTNLDFWIVQTIAMCLTCWFLPGLKVTSIFGPLLMVAALAFVNANFWSASLFFDIPLTPTSSTLSIFLMNAGIFWVLVKLLPGIESRGFTTVIFAPVIFTVTNLMCSHFLSGVDWTKVATQGVAVMETVRDEVLEERERLLEQSSATPPPSR